MGVIILSITPLIKYVSAEGWEASTLLEAYTDNMTDMEQVTQVAKGVSELWKTGRYLLWKDNNILT